jgi:lipid-A-disaccharide synthase-like uncharacterized protein
LDQVTFHVLDVAITPWKLVGYLGVVLFAGRWFVQMYYSRKRRRPVVPTVFWLMSISGSLLLLSYFSFGKNDSVGLLSNLFPGGVAGYNLYLDLRNRRRAARKVCSCLDQSGQSKGGEARRSSGGIRGDARCQGSRREVGRVAKGRIRASRSAATVSTCVAADYASGTPHLGGREALLFFARPAALPRQTIVMRRWPERGVSVESAAEFRAPRHAQTPDQPSAPVPAVTAAQTGS